MTTVACGSLEGPTSTVIPRDLTNARVRARRNAGVVNSLYVYTQDRLSNVIVDRYRAAAVSLRYEARWGWWNRDRTSPEKSEEFVQSITAACVLNLARFPVDQTAAAVAGMLRKRNLIHCAQYFWTN